MRESLWSDEEAAAFVARYGPEHGEDLALRVYASRLIGGDTSLVLHGGGNTSVKGEHVNVLGEAVPALYVKGSGWDLGDIEPAGFPAVDLAYCRRLRDLDALTDEQMVNELRTHLFDASAPNPSVETLLHAFLPAKYVDHSHADAILALTNNRDHETLLDACFGDDLVRVPYVMPGFALSKLAARCHDERPDAPGMVLLRHGLFTYGDTARESYERHVEIVRRAEAFLAERAGQRVVFHIPLGHRDLGAVPDAARVLPIVRGALAVRAADGTVAKRFVLDVRRSEQIDAFLAEAADSAPRSGPLTPDHTLRTKLYAQCLRFAGDDETAWSAAVARDLDDYATRYDAYFRESTRARGATRTRLDPRPRVLWLPGLGIAGVGETARAAAIAADITEHTIGVKSLVGRFSTYEGLGDLDLFDVEYWSLEQAKLGRKQPPPLQGQVAVVTGGTGAIGVGVARVLKDAGAEVVIADVRDVGQVAARLGVRGVEMDVTDEAAVARAFAEICARYGGVDIVVPNAGIAVSGAIEALSREQAHALMEVNFHGAFLVMREAAGILKRQGTGGHVVLISSKNVLAPGKEFSLYSASKAAAHQLAKVAALEFAPAGISVNMVTPDAVFGTDSDPSGLWNEVGPARAQAHGVDMKGLEAHYRGRSLLGRAVTAEHVGHAVRFFVTEQTPTTGATLPVDAGVAGAFPR